MVLLIWVHIGSGYGLLSDNTEPLPEPIVIDQKLVEWNFIKCVNKFEL